MLHCNMMQAHGADSEQFFRPFHFLEN